MLLLSVPYGFGLFLVVFFEIVDSFLIDFAGLPCFHCSFLCGRGPATFFVFLIDATDGFFSPDLPNLSRFCFVYVVGSLPEIPNRSPSPTPPLGAIVGCDFLVRRAPPLLIFAPHSFLFSSFFYLCRRYPSPDS